MSALVWSLYWWGAFQSYYEQACIFRQVLLTCAPIFAKFTPQNLEDHMKVPSVQLVPLKSDLLSEEALVFLVFEGEKNIASELARVFAKADVAKMTNYAKKRKFEGKLKQITHIPFNDDTVVIVVGLGQEKDLNLEQYRKASCAALSVLGQLHIQSAAYVPAQTSKARPQDVVSAVAEGVQLGSYEFDIYKSKEKDAYVFEGIRIVVDAVSKALEAALERTTKISEAVYFTRDLENENSIEVNPATFAAEALKVAKELKLKYKVLEEPELKKQNMNLLRAVGRGAEVPPRLVVLEYNGTGNKKVDIALAGKGITFDTGGINLKPAGWVHQMHIDMAGAATVLATMALAARLKLKKHIVGVMAMAENAIGSKSYKPGIILRSHSGKTVEIADTDAEGRLVLADALSYVVKEYQPQEVVDLATLTGAILVSLGSSAAGIFSNDKKLTEKLIAAGATTHERLWEMPMYPEFLEETKGVSSDLKNLGTKMRGGYAGSSVAAIFLQQFIGETKWAHLDIAGTAIIDSPQDYMPRNGTGFGVRLLTEYLS